MSPVARLAALLLLGMPVLALAQSPAYSAAAKATFFACKTRPVFKKAFERPAGKADQDTKDDKDKREAYFKAKVASGDCTQLARGEEVSVDQRDGDLWCVRPSGDLDCYWTADKAIDLNPSASPAGAQPHGSRHH